MIAIVIVTMGEVTSDLALGVHLLIDRAAPLGGKRDTIEADMTWKVLDDLIQASRLHLSSTVPKLLIKHGMAPPLGDLLWRKPMLVSKTLLNLIKVLRMSAWPRTRRICI